MNGEFRTLKRRGVCAACGKTIYKDSEEVLRIPSIKGRLYGMSLCKSCVKEIGTIYLTKND